MSPTAVDSSKRKDGGGTEEKDRGIGGGPGELLKVACMVELLSQNCYCVCVSGAQCQSDYNLNELILSTSWHASHLTRNNIAVYPPHDILSLNFCSFCFAAHLTRHEPQPHCQCLCIQIVTST